MTDLVALFAEELPRHFARYNTQYNGRGGVAHEDHGGLWCSCGEWDSGPVEGIRPWNEYWEHVAAELVAVSEESQ